MPVNENGPVDSVNTRAQVEGSSQSGGGGFIPARVIDISLFPSPDGRSTYQLTDGFAGIGAIKIESLNSNNIGSEFPQGAIAYPLDGNYRKMPLINELVFVVLGPSKRINLDGDSNASDFYYTSTINVWNGVTTNLLPSPDSIPSSTNNTSNQNVEDGIENQETTTPFLPKTGNFFIENPSVRSLYPQEGDVLLEGRFGNSLRFSSTMTLPSGSNETQSPWSSTGKAGSPITILRNGQVDAGFRNNDWFPIYENIQQDDSSIYLTSGQNINVLLASSNFISYGIDAISGFDTTRDLQETELDNNPTISPKEADTIETVYDIVNVEPALSPTPIPEDNEEPNRPSRSTSL